MCTKITNPSPFIKVNRSPRCFSSRKVNFKAQVGLYLEEKIFLRKKIPWICFFCDTKPWKFVYFLLQMWPFRQICELFKILKEKSVWNGSGKMVLRNAVGHLRKMWTRKKKMVWEKKKLTNNQAFMVEPVREGHAEWNSNYDSVYCETLQLSWIINWIWHWNFLPVLMNGLSPHLMTQGGFLSSFQGRSCPLSEGRAKSLWEDWSGSSIPFPSFKIQWRNTHSLFQRRNFEWHFYSPGQNMIFRWFGAKWAAPHGVPEC